MCIERDGTDGRTSLSELSIWMGWWEVGLLFAFDGDVLPRCCCLCCFIYTYMQVLLSHTHARTHALSHQKLTKLTFAWGASAARCLTRSSLAAAKTAVCPFARTISTALVAPAPSPMSAPRRFGYRARRGTCAPPTADVVAGRWCQPVARSPSGWPVCIRTYTGDVVGRTAVSENRQRQPRNDIVRALSVRVRYEPAACVCVHVYVCESVWSSVSACVFAIVCCTQQKQHQRSHSSQPTWLVRGLFKCLASCATHRAHMCGE